MKAETLKKCIELVASSLDSPMFIEVKNNVLCVGGASHLHGVLAYAPAVENNLFLCIPGNFAKQLTRILKTGNVTFLFEGEHVTVHCGRAKMKIGCLPDDTVYENMILKNYDDSKMFRINGSNFVTAIQKVRHNANDAAISDAVLLGFHITLKPESIEFMTTNARAVARTYFPSTTGVAEDVVKVLNNKFDNIIKLIQPDTLIGLNDKTLCIQSSFEDGIKVKVVSPLVAGAPKPYEPMFKSILNQCDSEVILEKKALQEIIKTVEFFDDKEEKLRVELTFGEFTLLVKTKTSKGESENYLDYSKIVNLPNKDLTIVLHPDIILKAIGSIQGELVTIKFGDSKKPIHLSDSSVENLLTVFLT